MRTVFVLLFLAPPAFVGCDRATPPSPPSTVPPAAASASSSPSSSSAGNAVDLPGGGRAYLVTAAGAGKHPAVILIHEWWGLTDWIKDDAARFAHQGYVALAVDLYRGHAAADPGEAHELMRGLSDDRAMGDMKAGVDWLTGRPDVDAARIGAIGWCMGGGYSLGLATAEPRLRAVVVNYGKLVTAPDKIDAIHASLLGNFAGNDRGIKPEDVRAFDAELKAKHKESDVKIYDGKNHAFMNPNNKEGYDMGAH
jgi:carboxymethylenebutenolidase